MAKVKGFLWARAAREVDDHLVRIVGLILHHDPSHQ
jgi:hypothetical protein